MLNLSIAVWALIFLIFAYSVGGSPFGFTLRRFAISATVIPFMTGFYWLMDKFSSFMLLPIQELF